MSAWPEEGAWCAGGGIPIGEPACLPEAEHGRGGSKGCAVALHISLMGDGLVMGREDWNRGKKSRMKMNQIKL